MVMVDGRAFRFLRFGAALCLGPLCAAAPTARLKRSHPSGRSSISGVLLSRFFIEWLEEVIGPKFAWKMICLRWPYNSKSNFLQLRNSDFEFLLF
jgi:hypothetical protein